MVGLLRSEAEPTEATAPPSRAKSECPDDHEPEDHPS